MTKTVLVTGHSEDASSLAGALEGLGLEPRSCPAGELVSRVRAERPAVIVLGPSQENLPELIASISRELKAERPPVLAVIAREDASLRDRCMVSGASEICWEPGSRAIVEAIAGLARWTRAPLRRSLTVRLKARRAKERLELAATDIDPTGLALASADGLIRGELLQILLPLPGEPLPAWGRVVGHQGGPAVRFLGMMPSERDLLVDALEGQPAPAATAEVTPLQRPDRLDTPQPPPESPAASAVDEVEDGLEIEPVEETPAQPLPDDSIEDGDDGNDEISPVEEEVPSVESGTPGDPPKKEGVGDIAAAIGELLGEEALPDLVGSGGEHAAEGPADPRTQVPWPSASFDAQASFEALLAVANAAAAPGGREGTPPPEVLAAYVKTLLPAERRLLVEDEWTEMPGGEIDRRTLGLRARLFAVILEGEQLHASEDRRAAIDSERLAALANEVNAALDEYQKLIDALFPKGMVTEVRDLGHSRSSLGRALADLRRVERVLRGEEKSTYMNLALLNAAEGGGTIPAPVRRPPQAERKPEKKPTVLAFAPKEMSPAAKRRIRLGIYLAMFVAALVFAALNRPPKPKSWSSDELRQFPGVIAAVIRDDRKGVSTATLTVSELWSPESDEILRLQSKLAQGGVRQVIMVDKKGRIVATGNDKTKFTLVAAP